MYRTCRTMKRVKIVNRGKSYVSSTAIFVSPSPSERRSTHQPRVASSIQFPPNNYLYLHRNQTTSFTTFVHDMTSHTSHIAQSPGRRSRQVNYTYSLVMHMFQGSISIVDGGRRAPDLSSFISHHGTYLPGTMTPSIRSTNLAHQFILEHATSTFCAPPHSFVLLLLSVYHLSRS